MTREPGRAPPRHACGDLTSLAPHEMLPEILVVHLYEFARSVLAKHHRQQKCVVSRSGGWKIEAVVVRLVPLKAMTKNLSQAPLQLLGVCDV